MVQIEGFAFQGIQIFSEPIDNPFGDFLQSGQTITIHTEGLDGVLLDALERLVISPVKTGRDITISTVDAECLQVHGLTITIRPLFIPF